MQYKEFLISYESEAAEVDLPVPVDIPAIYIRIGTKECGIDLHIKQSESGETLTISAFDSATCFKDLAADMVINFNDVNH